MAKSLKKVCNIIKYLAVFQIIISKNIIIHIVIYIVVNIVLN